jgi:hypothetical protein
MQTGKIPPLNLTNYNIMTEELMRQLFAISTALHRAGASTDSLKTVEQMGHRTFNVWLGREGEQ